MERERWGRVVVASSFTGDGAGTRPLSPADPPPPSPRPTPEREREGRAETEKDARARVPSVSSASRGLSLSSPLPFAPGGANLAEDGGVCWPCLPAGPPPLLAARQKEPKASAGVFSSLSLPALHFTLGSRSAARAYSSSTCVRGTAVLSSSRSTARFKAAASRRSSVGRGLPSEEKGEREAVRERGLRQHGPPPPVASRRPPHSLTCQRLPDEALALVLRLLLALQPLAVQVLSAEAGVAAEHEGRDELTASKRMRLLLSSVPLCRARGRERLCARGVRAVLVAPGQVGARRGGVRRPERRA